MGAAKEMFAGNAGGQNTLGAARGPVWEAAARRGEERKSSSPGIIIAIKSLCSAIHDGIWGGVIKKRKKRKKDTQTNAR